MSYTFEAPIKDPQAILRHEMDWTAWLGEGETIVGTPTIFSSAPDDFVVDQPAHVNGRVSWRVSGGQSGVNYFVTVRIATNQGRADERSVLYKVRER